MNEIHATRTSLYDDHGLLKVIVHFADENGADLLPGDRWYEAAVFDADPAAAIANVKTEIDAKTVRPDPIELTDEQAAPVVMMKADIEVKQAEIKKAADDAAIAAAADSVPTDPPTP